jgi:hypothetical protein
MIPRFILTERLPNSEKSIGTCPECSSVIATSDDSHTTCNVCSTRLLNVKWNNFVSTTLVAILIFFYCVINAIS